MTQYMLERLILNALGTKVNVTNNEDGELACRIGDYWFYFAGMLEADMPAGEYLKTHDGQEIAENIAYVILNDICETERDYYVAVLMDGGSFIKKSLADPHTGAVTFKVASGRMFATDPGYERTSWAAEEIADAKDGEWKSMVLLHPGTKKPAFLFARHGSFEKEPEELGKPSETYECGVDSGQFGFFDHDTYDWHGQFKGKYPYRPDHDYGSMAYGFCCDLTLSKEGAGLIPSGCVSRTYYGDGCYQVRAYRDDDGKCVALLADFDCED